MTTGIKMCLAVIAIDIILAVFLRARGRRHVAGKYMIEACIDAAILGLFYVSQTCHGVLYDVSHNISSALTLASILFRIHILYEHIGGDIRIMKEEWQQRKDSVPEGFWQTGDRAKSQKRRSLSTEDIIWMRARKYLAAERRNPAVTLVLALFILLLAAPIAQFQFLVLKGFFADGISVRILSALVLLPLAFTIFSYKKLKKKFIWAAALVLSVFIDLFVFMAWTAFIIDALSPDARPSIMLCDLVLFAFAGKTFMRFAKAVQAELSIRSVKRTRNRLKKDIDEALAEGGKVIFPGSGRRKGAVIMPDGKVRKLHLDRYADILLKDKARILPGESAENALTPVPEAVLACGNGKNVRRWAAEVRRGARKKCAELREVSTIIDIKDRSVVGITKDGRIVCVHFPERVYCIFDQPDELIWAKGCAWRMLRKKLLPANVLAGVKKYCIEEE